jgi:hypothetical protein
MGKGRFLISTLGGAECPASFSCYTRYPTEKVLLLYSGFKQDVMASEAVR